MARRASPAHLLDQPQRVAFACGFARRNCPHETMFQDAYQRTNRTRGTKILRCFPHCCPRHIERSYCGGSVYLQVDLARGDPDAVDDTALCVFAHFRPKALPGLAPGQFVSRAMFRENQQTDTNATGEWIGARLMASADHTTWMFEVNPSGRWYYQWESGATKVQRATEHVFEAYVLVMDAANERCEVVAKAVSRDFKMISFRRAPSEPKPGTPNVTPTGSPATRRADEDRDSKSTIAGEAIAAAASPSLAWRWMQRDSVDSIVSSDAEIASQFQALMENQSLSRNSSPQVDGLSRERLTRPSIPRLPTPLSPFAFAGLSPDEDEDAHVDLAPLSLMPSPQIIGISHALGVLMDFVQALPCAALELVAPEIRGQVLAPFVVVAGDDSRTNGPSLAALLGLPHGDGAARSASSSSSFPPALAGVVLRLALWVLFDRELTQALEAFVERASAGLLDKVALYESYYAWLDRLDHHIETYFAATRANATLVGLANDAHRWLRTSASGYPSLAPGTGSVTGCRGLESFVAQARELFLAGGDLGSHRRRRRPQRQEDVANEPDNYELALFSAVWVTDVDSIQWRAAAAAQDSPPSSSGFSTFVTMWAWRQVLGLNLQVDDGESTAALPTVTVSSLWNASRRPPPAGSTGNTAVVRGSRLVLDGKPRWLRVYPSGESTSSVTIGSQRLGHYVASFRSELRELLVNLYSWPTTNSTDACCYCSRWCLRLEPGDNELCVRVAVERGCLRSGVDTAALDETPLTHKLQAVEDWTTTASLQYAYRRR